MKDLGFFLKSIEGGDAVEMLIVFCLNQSRYTVPSILSNSGDISLQARVSPPIFLFDGSAPVVMDRTRE